MCGSIFAQEESEPTVIQTISVSKGQAQQVHDKAYYEQKIKDIDELIEAIEIKKAYVRSDESEHKLALEIGWYENMEAEKAEALIQRKEYENLIKKMTH